MVAVAVGVPGVCEGVLDGLALPDREADAGLRVLDGLKLRDGVVDRDREMEGVMDVDTDTEGVMLMLMEVEGVVPGAPDRDGDTEGVTWEGDALREAEFRASAPRGEDVGVEEGVGVGVGVWVGVGVLVRVGDSAASASVEACRTRTPTSKIAATAAVLLLGPMTTTRP